MTLESASEMQPRQKYATCPARIRNKRDLPSLWDVESTISAADPTVVLPSVSEFPQEQLLGLAEVHESKEGPQQDAPAMGSWPRVSRRRNNTGGAMSLWEVSEALSKVLTNDPSEVSEQADIAGLDALEALVAAESDPTPGLAANEISEADAFVNSVFGNHACVFSEEHFSSLPSPRSASPSQQHEPQHTQYVQQLPKAGDLAPGFDPLQLLAILQEDPTEGFMRFDAPLSPSPTSVTAAAQLDFFNSELPPIADLSDLSPFDPETGLMHSASDSSDARTDATVPIAAPAAATGMKLSGGRNGVERKEWTAAEDHIIRSSVEEFGCRWRKIAAQLPGRSDDAVRNRWSRIKEPHAALISGEQGVTLPVARRASSDNTSGSKPERVSWTQAEDATIISGVQDLGHKWNRIAERLPGRTDHAIRNRFHRLQSMLRDRQQQNNAGRMDVPFEPFHCLQPSTTSIVAN